VADEVGVRPDFVERALADEVDRLRSEHLAALGRARDRAEADAEVLRGLREELRVSHEHLVETAAQRAAQEDRALRAEAALTAVHESRSWRSTAALRRVSEALSRDHR
jgi:hypothetical protein